MAHGGRGESDTHAGQPAGRASRPGQRAAESHAKPGAAVPHRRGAASKDDQSLWRAAVAQARHGLGG